MKVLIVSDSHRHDQNLADVIGRVGHIDHLIHLGDAEGSEDYIEQIAGCPVHIVAGNCDFFSRFPYEDILVLGGYRILITHGHHFYVTMGLQELRNEAKAQNCRIAMFGHTHRPVLDYSDKEVTVVNPGSISFPRQEGRCPTYMIMEIDREGEVHFTLNYLKK